MAPLQSDEKYDLYAMISRPLYFGMVVNVLIPMALLLICYFVDKQGSWYNRIGDSAVSLFYLIIVVSVAQGGLALWWRKKMVAEPMIRRQETFEEDLSRGLSHRSRQIFLLIALIALYGFIYFLLTAMFQETMAIVILSFIVFQFVRPRFGFLRKLIAQQEALVEQGKFRRELG